MNLEAAVLEDIKGRRSFSVAELYEAHGGADNKATVSAVNRVVAAGRGDGSLFRASKGRWKWREPLPRPAPARESDEDDDSDQVAIWRAQREEAQERRRARLEKLEQERAVVVSRLRELGVELVFRSEYHCHLVRGGRVLAQWWPSTGTTRLGEERGQRCQDGAALVRWIRKVVAP